MLVCFSRWTAKMSRIVWKNHWCEPLINGIVKYRWALPCFQGDSSSGFLPASWDTPSLSDLLTSLALVIVLLYMNRLLFSTCSILLCFFFDMSAFFIRLKAKTTSPYSLHILHLRHYLKYGWHHWRFFDSINIL